jgi:pimeloyl-ACP methyl ester carboxylesterase
MPWGLDWKNLWREEPVHIDQVQSPVYPLNVIWLHGANQSAQSFAYLREILPPWPSTLINYNSQNGFWKNLSQMLDAMDLTLPSIVVGHSMGGLYAVHLAQKANVVAAVSIASPFGGSVAAQWARVLYPRYQLFRDVAVNSDVIRQTAAMPLKIPWLQLVSTAGNVPYLESANDGVVTVHSMQARLDVQCVSLPYTHYDIICNQQTAIIIEHCYQQAQNNL